MTIYEFITQPSFPITLEGVIEDIRNGLITLRNIESGRKIIILHDSENIEYYLKHFIFWGEELSDDEHTFYTSLTEEQR